MKAWLPAVSMRYPPPVPAQLLLTPNDVTAAMVRLSPWKIGPPESPKQVPPEPFPPPGLLVNEAEVPLGMPNTPLTEMSETVPW
jgi:hypothetical protein